MADPFERLPRQLRIRLDAFSALVDGVATDQLLLLGVVPRGGEHEVAHNAADDRVEELARRTNRTEAIAAIRDVALDYVARRFSHQFQDPRQPFLGRGVALQTRGDERARLAASFGDALTAIALSDVLDSAEVDLLLGPWVELADAAER